MTGQRPYDAAGAHAGRRPVRRCPAAGRWRGRRPSAAGRRGGGRCGSLPGAVLRWDGGAMLPDRQRIARMRWVPFRTIDGRLTTVAASPDVPEARVCSMLRWMDGRVHAAAPLSALLQPSGRGLCRRPSAGVVADRAVLAAAEDRGAQAAGVAARSVVPVSARPWFQAPSRPAAERCPGSVPSHSPRLPGADGRSGRAARGHVRSRRTGPPARSHSAAAGSEARIRPPLVVPAAGIALAGLAFYSRRCVSVPRAQTTAFMEYRPAGAMMRLSP
jgi:hypothetical protein